MPKEYYVYILTNKPGGTLYIGITSDLSRRIQEHRAGTFDGFTKTHRLHRLVYYETYQTPWEAIQREKNLKEWHRAWKIRLIKTTNPEWKDLSGEEVA
jgi:putative endonuclease